MTCIKKWKKMGVELLSNEECPAGGR